MTSTARTDNVDLTDLLPPTQYLLIEVLAARWRLGEQVWTFPRKMLPALRALQDLGLIWFDSAPTYGDYQARFTDRGRLLALGPTYRPPVELAEAAALNILHHYSAALDEVYRMRAAVAIEAYLTKGKVLSMRTLPARARADLDAMVARLAAAARGHAEGAYSFASDAVRKETLRAVGGRPTLTRFEWENGGHH